MTENQSEFKKGKDWFKIYIFIDIIILILSIIIPYLLIMLNQLINGCGHHGFSSTGPGAILWIWGRSLGFTCFIWFCITTYRGYTTKKKAKLFHSMQKAKNLHCYEALITIIILVFHVSFLLTSDPWNSLILGRMVAHFPFALFAIKIWTGIIFGAIMVGTSILFFYLKDVKRLKKFGYKKMIWVHKLLLVFTIVLAIHIFLINIELWLLLTRGNIGDD